MRKAAPGTPSIRGVSFLQSGADSVSGIARTVNNLANHLVDRHEVEIISVVRRRDKPKYPVDPRVKLTYLAEGRGIPTEGRPPRLMLGPNGQPRARRMSAWLDGRPSRLGPRREEPLASRLTDLLLWRQLRTLQPGVLVTTHPSLLAAALRMAPDHSIIVGWDHLNFETRVDDPGLLELLQRSGDRLDSLVVLTQADADDYRRELAGNRTVVTAIPNALPWPLTDREPSAATIVLAAGRFVAQKSFDRLIQAYAPLAQHYPEWRLHIYGRGRDRPMLRKMIGDLGLKGKVELKEYTEHFDQVLASASVYAMTSRYEGFPMALLEAMGKGLALVSFDCPRGPAEMVVDGVNGRLVPNNDVEAFTAALGEVMADSELRARMQRASRDAARKYQTDQVAQRWESLFEELLTRRSAVPG